MSATFAIPIIHQGTSADLAKVARSFVKENIDVLNSRTNYRTVSVTIGTDTRTSRNPYTEEEIDGLSSARLERAVKMLLRDRFEADAKDYDERVAEAALVNPVSGRDDQTEIDDTID